MVGRRKPVVFKKAKDAAKLKEKRSPLYLMAIDEKLSSNGEGFVVVLGDLCWDANEDQWRVHCNDSELWLESVDDE